MKVLFRGRWLAGGAVHCTSQRLRRDWEQNPAAVQTRTSCQTLALPLFVKPANLGSSVGISKVKHGKENLPGSSLGARLSV